MYGPQQLGYWSAALGSNGGRRYRFLRSDARYQVVREFTDFDGDLHSIGETWIFRGYSFLPHDDGLSIFVSLSANDEWLIRLQDRRGAQAEVVDNLNQYVTLVVPE